MSITRRVIRPTQGSASELARHAAVYRAGRTPVEDAGGTFTSLDARPADTLSTASHLRAVYDEHGQSGVSTSYAGLRSTRGAEFARASMAHAGFSPGLTGSGGALSPNVAHEIGSSAADRGLPAPVRTRLERAAGLSFSGVRVHDNPAAHRAADTLGARAFTLGQSVYFGPGEWQPNTHAGLGLIAHEVAHTVQQRGAAAPAPAATHVNGEGGADESEAAVFAGVVERGGTMSHFTSSSGLGRLQRALRFGHSGHTIATNPITGGPNESAIGFRLQANPGPAFAWGADVTVHGAPGDPFANFEAGTLQVVRDFWFHGVWGSGANQTRRRGKLTTPIRDSLHDSDTWTRSTAPDVTAAFGADGDVRSPRFTDTPAPGTQPWANPIAGRVSTTGSFNNGVAFVTYIGVRDTTKAVRHDAFRILASRYWNQSCAGVWDEARPVGTRLVFTEGPSVNRGGVIEGEAAEFPAMIGGATANSSASFETK